MQFHTKPLPYNPYQNQHFYDKGNKGGVWINLLATKGLTKNKGLFEKLIAALEF